MEPITIELQGGYHLRFEEDANKRLRLVHLGNERNFLKGPSPLLSIETREGNHGGDHAEKFVASPFGEFATLVRVSSSKEGDVSVYAFVQSDGAFETVSTIRVYSDAPGFRISHSIKNISSSERILENASSFYLQNFGSENVDRVHEGMEVSFVRNSWCSEGQWRTHSFLEEGLFNASHRMNVHRFLLHSAGSWSTADYLPLLMISDKEKGISLLGEVENPGPWAIEVGDHDNAFYASFGGPNWNDCHFSLRLQEGESFETVPATIVLGDGLESCLASLTNARRHLLPDSDDLKDLPVIYNDFMHGLWGTQKEADILPLIDSAKDAGAEVFCLDAGWFNGAPDWPSSIGEWKEDPSNYPTLGLKGLLDKIRASGMKVGIWTEIESVGLKSPIASAFPKECFFQLDGRPVIRNNRYILDLSNETAFDHALSLLSELIFRFDIDYLKNDYNLSTGPGTDRDGVSPGLGLLRHGEALLALYDELHRRFPHLTIESCASGGMRMDYGMLSRCPIQSVTDCEELEYLPYIVGGSLAGVNPEQAGIWCYPRHSRAKEITDEMVIASLVYPQVGRIHLASKLNLLPKEQMDLVKEGIAFYKAHRSLRKEAVPIFPLGPARFFEEVAVVGLLGSQEGVLDVTNCLETGKRVSIDLSRYGVEAVDLAFAKSHPIPFSYENGVLTIDFSEGRQSRCFLLKTK